VYTTVFIRGTKQALRHSTINRTHLGTLFLSAHDATSLCNQLPTSRRHKSPLPSQVLAVRYECQVVCWTEMQHTISVSLCAHLPRCTGTSYQHRPDWLLDKDVTFSTRFPGVTDTQHPDTYRRICVWLHGSMEQKGENVTVMVPLTQGDTEHYSTR